MDSRRGSGQRPKAAWAPGPGRGSSLRSATARGCDRIEARQLRRPRPGDAPAGSSLRGEARSRRGNHRLKTRCPRRLLFAARPCIEGFLRPQARGGGETQRRGHLPRAPAMRCHPRHAPLACAVSGEGPARPAGRRLMASTRLASGARGPDEEDGAPLPSSCGLGRFPGRESGSVGMAQCPLSLDGLGGVATGAAGCVNL